MKKILLFSTLAMCALACNNNVKTEEQEARERDSIDQAQKSIDQRFVDSLEAADMEAAHGHTHEEGDTSHSH